MPTQVIEDDGSVAAEAETEGLLPSKRAGAEERAVLQGLTGILRIAKRGTPADTIAAQGAFFTAIVPYLQQHKRARILLGEGSVSLEGCVLKPRAGGRGWLHDLIETLTRLGAAAIIFEGEWSALSVKTLTEAFGRVEGSDPPSRVRSIAELAAQVAPPARCEVLGDEAVRSRGLGTSGEDELTESQRAAFAFARLLALTELCYDSIAQGHSPDACLRDLRQAIAHLVDACREIAFETRLLALGALPYVQGKALAGHAVNTAIVSLAMGRILGLSRAMQFDLVFAALFHDMGRPPDGWPGNSEGEDRSVRENHPVKGLAVAVEGSVVTEPGLVRLIVALEHHRKDGFPRDRSFSDPHVLSRVVSVAEQFDRLEKGTPWVPAVGPAAAIRQMQAQKWRFEEPLTTLLRDALGAYPRGTLLKLQEGSVVVVIDSGARWADKPVVRRLLLPDGTADTQRKVAEVGNPETIAEELDPAQVAFDWRRAVLA